MIKNKTYFKQVEVLDDLVDKARIKLLTALANMNSNSSQLNINIYNVLLGDFNKVNDKLNKLLQM